MLIPLGKHAYDPATGRGLTEDNGITPREIYHYTCKHYDRERRICGIYNERPQVCRSFPDNSSCKYVTCGWKAAREGRVLNYVLPTADEHGLCEQRVITVEELAKMRAEREAQRAEIDELLAPMEEQRS